MTAVSIKAQSLTLRLQRPAAPTRLRPDARPALADEAIDWSQASMTELVAHLRSAHHATLREVLAPLIERTTRLVEEVPAHAEPASRLVSLLGRLDLHMRKLEQVVYPLLRRVDDGRHGAVLLPKLIGPDALDLAADVAALQEDLDGLRHLARHCPHPETILVARKLDDRARRFLRLEARLRGCGEGHVSECLRAIDVDAVLSACHSLLAEAGHR